MKTITLFLLLFLAALNANALSVVTPSASGFIGSVNLSPAVAICLSIGAGLAVLSAIMMGISKVLSLFRIRSHNLDVRRGREEKRRAREEKRQNARLDRIMADRPSSEAIGSVSFNRWQEKTYGAADRAESDSEVNWNH